LQWVRQNLAQFVAITTLAGHVHGKPSACGLHQCLLKHPVGKRFLPVEGILSLAEGCYLYYDTVNGQWIRSGKVAGTEHDSRGFGDRDEEHEKNATRGASGSGLYIDYPGKRSNRVKVARENKVRPYPWKAYFEDLALFCGIGFTRSDSVEKHLTVDFGRAERGNNERGNDERGNDDFQGVFSWKKPTIDALSKWSKNSEFTMKDKQLHMVAYLLELGYDLMLDNQWNVSTQPGFEMFGLVNLK